ncbi:hypothetical protein Rsub_03337 [Raphidocelis subcapitata]|uniref:Uncharacterized protein n=1 Tax=Raphidocelis subcapitata TaxID=307507 RepID=A0A2V0NRD7_9CHLO|nr:hypothetical protein Rsub_03337 [Raphidocelis subcapitata]|eukprot:GBF90204.1 hypothetical protein Rsub_03337 [Raphidocelis subcapitata]
MKAAATALMVLCLACGALGASLKAGGLTSGPALSGAGARALLGKHCGKGPCGVPAVGYPIGGVGASQTQATANAQSVGNNVGGWGVPVGPGYYGGKGALPVVGPVGGVSNANANANANAQSFSQGGVSASQATASSVATAGGFGKGASGGSATANASATSVGGGVGPVYPTVNPLYGKGGIAPYGGIGGGPSNAQANADANSNSNNGW